MVRHSTFCVISVLLLALVATLVVSQELFDCNFSSGISYTDNDVLKDSQNVGNWSHVSFWAGYDKKFHDANGNAVRLAKNWNVPIVVYGYVIAFAARHDKGIDDCNVTSFENSLCYLGADYIRQNRQSIIDLYGMIAQNIKNISGGQPPYSIWKIEPDFYQYSANSRMNGNPNYAQANGGISNTDLAAFYKDIRLAIIAQLPNAKVGIDISPWMGAYADTWYPSFSASDVDFFFTSGGVSDPTSPYVDGNNGSFTWQKASNLLGSGDALRRPIIADCGYGTGGAQSGSCTAWFSSINTLKNMYNLNVVSITISPDQNNISQAAGWSNSLPSDHCEWDQDDVPYIPGDNDPVCPVNPIASTSNDMFGCGISYGVPWNWYFQQFSGSNPFTMIKMTPGPASDDWIFNEGMPWIQQQGNTLVVYGNIAEYTSGYTACTTSTNTNSWCSNGSNYLRDSTSGSTAYSQTVSWIQRYAKQYASNKQLVWIVEPTLPQLYKAASTPLTSNEVAAFFNNVYNAVKLYMPNARLAFPIDASMSIAQLTTYISAIPQHQISYFYIGNQQVLAQGNTIVQNGQMTYDALKTAFSIPLIIDVSNDISWVDQTVATTRYNQGVSAILYTTTNINDNDMVGKVRSMKQAICSQAPYSIQNDTTPYKCRGGICDGYTNTDDKDTSLCKGLALPILTPSSSIPEPEPECSATKACPSGQECVNSKCQAIVEPECSPSKACPSGQECVNSKCQAIAEPECSATKACPSGQECVNSKCQAIAEPECSTTKACPSGQECVNSKCRAIVEPECSSTKACPSGQECVNSKCQAVVEPECSQSKACPSGQECVNSKCQAVVEPECSPSKACPSGQECVNSKCQAIAEPECSESKSCPTGQECIGGQCEVIDTSTDPECDDTIPCSDGYICVNEVCVSQNDYIPALPCSKTKHEECRRQGMNCQDDTCYPWRCTTSSVSRCQRSQLECRDGICYQDECTNDDDCDTSMKCNTRLHQCYTPAVASSTATSSTVIAKVIYVDITLSDNIYSSLSSTSLSTIIDDIGQYISESCYPDDNNNTTEIPYYYTSYNNNNTNNKITFIIVNVDNIEQCTYNNTDKWIQFIENVTPVHSNDISIPSLSMNNSIDIQCLSQDNNDDSSIMCGTSHCIGCEQYKTCETSQQCAGNMTCSNDNQLDGYSICLTSSLHAISYTMSLILLSIIAILYNM